MSTADITTKVCSQCGLEKPIYEFHKHAREKDGYRRNCKQCRAESGECRYIKPAPSGFQWCRKCDTLYPATRDYFYWDASSNRLYSSCKSCHYLRTRNWQKSNLEFWYILNRKWATAHPETMRLIRRVHSNRRRVRLITALGHHTKNDVLRLVSAQTDRKGRLRCWWCGKVIIGTYHVDHKIALAKNGSNDASNLVISCPVCNLSKKDKSPQEWAGRLL